jgi:hypothetical protein
VSPLAREKPQRPSTDPTPEDSWFEAIPSPLRRLGEFGLGSFWAFFLFSSLFPPSGNYLFPWLTIPFGALASFHFIRRAFDPSPRLIVDSFGVTDRTSFFGRELRVPWEQVTGVSVSKLNGVIEIEVRDLRELNAQASFGRRFELLFRRLRGKKTIGIGPSMLGLRHDEIGRRIDSALLGFERAQLGLSPNPTGNLKPGSEKEIDWESKGGA